MRSWASFTALAGGLSLALIACGGSDTGPAADASTADGSDGSVMMAPLGGPWEQLDERPCPPDNVLTWENFGASFVLANCTGCHGRGRPEGERQRAPVAVTFDDPASIRPLAARIWLRAADDNASMPPVGAPDAEQRRRFGQWLACGAPTQGDL